MRLVGVVVAVVVAGILIGVSVGSSSSTSRPVQGTAQTMILLSGIPQHGNVLGLRDAPVRLVEYGDLQCPICRAFALQTLPTLIQDYVRKGELSIEFRGIAFIGSDSSKALRAVVAAGAQNHEWDLVDVLYRNQGQENSGWFTDSLLLSAAAHVDGLDTKKLFADRGSSATAARIRLSAKQAGQLMGNQIRTPTFEVARAGQPVQPLPVQSLDASAFTPTLDRLLGR